MNDQTTQPPAADLSYRPRLQSMQRLGGAEAPEARAASEANEEIELERRARLRIRPPEYFDEQIRTGFDGKHLAGFEVDFPTPVGTRARDVFPVTGSKLNRLDYTHFSVVMSGSRRMAMMTAVNIEGQRSVSIPRDDDKWYLDGRIPVEAQTGEDMYEGNRLDRGHLVRREDPNWGAAAELANEDTFHFTNCAPQMDIVNQKTWLGLENYILQNARVWKERCSVFTGPIFGRSDLAYRGRLIPKAFWKVVAFLSDDGKPSATAYLVKQDEELLQLEAAFGAYKSYQRSIRTIEQMSGIRFGNLAQFDGLSNEEAITGVEISSELRSLDDIRV